MEHLNLYGTQVDDEGFEIMKDFKALKSLYLWQSEVSDKAVANFVDNNPSIQVNYQIDNSIFPVAKLKPPEIIASKNMFDDTLSVKLDAHLSGLKIFYTLDGSIPDSTSLLYEQPLKINKTIRVKSFCSKDGWLNSDISEQVFIKVGHKVVDVQLKEPPNDKYKANGAQSLIDLKKGTLSFADGEWLGFEGKHIEATLDLGEIKNINNIVVGALEDTGSYIFYPKGIVVQSSSDGKRYNTLQSLEYPTVEEPRTAELKSFLLEFETHTARYVKVKVEGTLNNPEWHAAPGAKNWIFIDEILVN